MPLTGSLVPTQTNWDYNVVDRSIEYATYQRLKLIPVIDEAMRLYNQLTIRKHARVQGVALAATADGTGLTYLNITGTPVTLVPVHSVVPVSWGPNFGAQHNSSKGEGGNGVDGEAVSNVTGALSELTESNVMANFTTATNFLSDTVATVTTVRQAMARLGINTNDNFGINGKEKVYGFFSLTQQPALQAMPEVNSAEMRGDEENPYVRGIWVNGFGFVLNTSSVVPQDVNGWHNALLVPSAMVVSWNMRTNIKRPVVELAETAIAQNNMGSNIKNDSRIFVIRTTTDAS